MQRTDSMQPSSWRFIFYETKASPFEARSSSALYFQPAENTPHQYKATRLILFRKIVVVNSEHHTKHINTTHVQNVLLNGREDRKILGITTDFKSVNIQGVTGGTDQTSEGCSLC